MFLKKTTTSLAVLCGLLFATSIYANEEKTNQITEHKGVVTYVVDGDRFILESPTKTQLVRMKWVDAPDDGQSLADESHTFLNELIIGREVVVLSDSEINGCVFGELIADGINYNHEMIRSGLAHTYSDAPTNYQTSAENAEKEKRGVWSSENSVDPNSAWKSVAEFRGGCQVEEDIVDYKAEKPLIEGQERYRYITTPIYVLACFFIGWLLWKLINHIDDPRIALNKKRLQRNKRELKDSEKNLKNENTLKDKYKDIRGIDKRGRKDDK